jgi:uncharacterized membrane-anchored protein YhcB (DUF1043 family)
MDQYKPLILSVGSAVISIGHFVIAAETRSLIAWVIGVIAGLYAIRTSHSAHKAHKAVEEKAKAETRVLDEQLRVSRNN